METTEGATGRSVREAPSLGASEDRGTEEAWWPFPHRCFIGSTSEESPAKAQCYGPNRASWYIAHYQLAASRAKAEELWGGFPESPL